MSTTWPSFSSLPPVGSRLPAAHAAPLPARLLQSWQQVHGLLTYQDWDAGRPADYASLGVYHYCVYKAFGRPADAALAQRLFERLLATLRAPTPPASGWSAQQLDQFGQAAWLHTHLAAEGLVPSQAPAPLTDLDHTLRHAAQGLREHESAGSYHNFFRVVRYFSLRQPGPAAQAHLHALLAAPLPLAGAVWPRPGALPEQLALGLTEGLAATLLLLSRLTRLGVPGLDLRASVRQGVQRLLALRQPVDFAEQCYAVFPYQVHSATGAASFSAELSWRRGDLGQAVLLYEAQELLQDTELANIAELVGLNTLLRTTVPTTQVTSSRLGHGAAGLAHLYHKLFYASGQQPAYQQGYVFWLAQTQSWLHQELAAGFYQHREGELLDGLAGVGLVLLSALSGTPLRWDTVVL
jgi:hypothetical protein